MTLREVAELVGGSIAPENGDVAILGVASLTEAGAGDISFYGSPKYLNALRKCQASAVFVPRNFTEDLPAHKVWVDQPAEAFALVLRHFAPAPVQYPAGVHPTAVVAEDVVLGEGVSIQPRAVVEAGVVIGAHTVVGAGVYIGHNARVGTNSFLGANSVIGERCVIGNHVTLQPAVVVGSDGFGYEFKDGRHEKIPQTGIVQIDDHVEIGSGTTLDRARFGRTWVQEGTKIDNLVQIGHNVIIGRHTIICAQVGISGSTRIGNYVTLAGKVGVNGHIEIGDQVIVTAMAGITKNVAAKEILIGLPARPMKEFKQNYVLTHNIQKLYDRVKVLEEQAKSSEA